MKKKDVLWIIIVIVVMILASEICITMWEADGIFGVIVAVVAIITAYAAGTLHK